MGRICPCGGEVTQKKVKRAGLVGNAMHCRSCGRYEVGDMHAPEKKSLVEFKPVKSPPFLVEQGWLDSVTPESGLTKGQKYLLDKWGSVGSTIPTIVANCIASCKDYKYKTPIFDIKVLYES